MYKLLLEDKEFKSMDLPLPVEKRELLEQLIQKDLCHEPVTVWHDRIIDGYERYALYEKYHRTYPVREETMMTRDEAIAWICQHQLKRQDLNSNAEAWLLYRLFSARCRRAKLSTPSETFILLPNRTEVQQQICRDYHISEASMRRYTAFGKQLDLLEESYPGTRQRILTGDLKVAREHMKALLAMPDLQLRRMIESPESRRLVPARKVRPITPRRRTDTQAPKIVPHTGIKQMPAYDPDAELNGLTFTVSSWEKAVTRVRGMADFQAASPAGKRRLHQALSGLMTEVGELDRKLEVCVNE